MTRGGGSGRGRTGTARSATFLFTDMEGSTRLLERLGDDYAVVLAEHWQVLRDAATAAGGEEFGAEGDAMFFAFGSAADAVTAAITGQVALREHAWPDGAGVKVRMALHTGSARVVFGTWVGLALHHTARICAAGHGGQVLVSSVTAKLLAQERPHGVRVESLGEYRLRDITGPQEIGQLEHADLPHGFPPLRTPMAAVTNLPDSLTSFIGRQSDISTLRGLLGDHRLVTITGPGGAGKTRLAYETAGDTGPHFDDGVWVAELAPIPTAWPGSATSRDQEVTSVARAVADAVGAAIDPAGETVEQLIAFLEPKQLLLVLDNCEHVIDPAAALTQPLLQCCPGLTVLATSREALRVSGEVAWPIPPMVEDAVRLFADRAAVARPNFDITADSDDAVRRICTRLDGIPLAIELAAARVSSLSVEQIERRLDDRFHLLTGGTRTALPRQQTLRALVDWSHDLLDEHEQVLLRQLSVFAGSFTLDDAEALVGARADAVAQLVAKSLLVMEESAGAARYRFLETIREYASERLQAAGETEEWYDAHLEVVATVVREAATRLLGPEQRDALDELDNHWPDVQQAIDRAVTAAPDTAVELAGALGPFFAIRGRVAEGLALIERALASAAPPVDREDHRWQCRLRALAAAGTLARAACDFGVSRRHHEEQLEMVRDHPNEELAAKALSSLGNVALLEGDVVEARRLCEQALDIRRRLGAPRPLALALNNLGVLADWEGDFAGAAAAYDEHLEIMRDIGDGRVVGQTLTNLALVRLATGDLDGAEAALDESLVLLREVGDTRSVAVTLAVQAGLLRQRGQLDSALDQYVDAFEMLTQLADRAGVAMAVDGIVTVLAARGAPEDHPLAARLLGATSTFAVGPDDRGRAEEDALAMATAALRDALGDDFDRLRADGAKAGLPTVFESLVGQNRPLRGRQRTT